MPQEPSRRKSLKEAGELSREATGPLKGVRILDMTSVVFGA